MLFSYLIHASAVNFLAGAAPPLFLNGSNTWLFKTARRQPVPPHQPRNRSSHSRPWATRSSSFPTRPLPLHLPLKFPPLRLWPQSLLYTRILYAVSCSIETEEPV